MRREFALPEEAPVIVMTEEVDAPIEKAWTVRFEPLYVAQWWHPRDYVNSIVEMDVEVGTPWRIAQRDPEGNEYAMYGSFLEVEPPRVAVQTMIFELFPGVVTHLTTEFQETQLGTLVVTTHDLGDDFSRRGYLRLGGLERMSEASDAYAELLDQLSPR